MRGRNDYENLLKPTGIRRIDWRKEFMCCTEDP
jgi:hypothetical protein